MSLSTSNIMTDSTVGTKTILNDTIQQEGAPGSMKHGEHVYSTTARVNKATDSVENDGTPLDVSVSQFDKGNEEADSEINNIQSSFNLAVIPAVAVLVFIVITCIKCCEWFRQYSRGGSNDENYYAVTIQDDEDDPMDVISDSTAYYDTVSSYCSFLKRSGNDSTLNSIRALRQHDNRNVQGSPPRAIISLIVRSDTTENNISESEIKIEASERKGGKDESQVAYYPITSSADTPSDQLTDTPSDQLTDTPNFRRSNKFRVSFVEHNPIKLSAIEHKHINDTIIRSSMKDSHCWEMNYCDSSIQEFRCLGRAMGKTVMVDVGTQTNKSFRYTLWNTKRHASDTDVEEKLTFNAIPLIVTRENQRDLQVSCDGSHVTQHPANTHVPHSKLNTYNDDTSTSHTDHHRRSLETRVEITHQSGEVGIELDDDVFVENIAADAIAHNNVTSCNSIARSCDEYSKTNIENCMKSNSDNCIKSNSNSSTKTHNIEDLNTNMAQSALYQCSDCNTSITHDISNELNDKVGDTIISALCEKCTILRTHSV